MDLSEEHTTCNSNNSPSPHKSPLDATAGMLEGTDGIPEEELFFHVNSLQEDCMGFINYCPFLDNIGHGHDMMHVQAEDESCIDPWDDIIDIMSQFHDDTSSFASRSMPSAHISSEVSGTNMADAGTAFIQTPLPSFDYPWGNLQDGTSAFHDAAASSARTLTSPAHFSETSETDDALTAFIELPSPGYSKPSFFAASQHGSLSDPYINSHHSLHSPCINNHVDENPRINPCMHSVSAASMCMPPSPLLSPSSAFGTRFTNTSFIRTSPVYSEESSHGAASHSHEPFHKSNHVDYYHEWKMHMHHPNPTTNSVRASIVPEFVDNYHPHGCFEDEATSFADFASLPHQERISAWPWLDNNLEARANQPQMTVETGVQASFCVRGRTTSSSSVSAPAEDSKNKTPLSRLPCVGRELLTPGPRTLTHGTQSPPPRTLTHGNQVTLTRVAGILQSKVMKNIFEILVPAPLILEDPSS